MVVLIIIPTKWLFHWEYTQHFQTYPYHDVQLLFFGEASNTFRWTTAPASVMKMLFPMLSAAPINLLRILPPWNNLNNPINSSRPWFLANFIYFIQWVVAKFCTHRWWCPSSLAKLVQISPISLWFMVLITIVFMGLINPRSHHWGAPPCRW